MKRRLFMAGMATTALAVRSADAVPSLSLPASSALAFRVMRHGSDIGRHQVTFQKTGERLSVSIEADMHIGIGPITLYRYKHLATEIWDGDHFASLDSNTDKNGTNVMVKARRTGDVVTIETGRAPLLTLPPDTIPFTHWNKEVTKAPLFNPQEGVPVDEKVVSFPTASFNLANGETIPASRFDFSGSAIISDWYDIDGKWLALKAVAPDGSTLQYEPII